MNDTERQAIVDSRAEKARLLYDKIISTLENDGVVTIATYTHARHYEKKHLDLFRCTSTGVYIKRGKSWDCIDYCGFRFYSRKPTE